jgi:hypothetical protein
MVEVAVWFNQENLVKLVGVHENKSQAHLLYVYLGQHEPAPGQLPVECQYQQSTVFGLALAHLSHE